MTLDDPTPLCVGQPGCAAMVRRPHGQWTACPGEPTHAGVRRRVRLFLCPQHVALVAGSRPMSDLDRAELDGRIVQWDRAMAGLPWTPPAEVEP